MRSCQFLQAAAAFGSLLTPESAKTAWQQRNYAASVPSTPVVTFSNNYTSKADAHAALLLALNDINNASIAYPGDFKYGTSSARVWTFQRQEHPEAIVFPNSPEQVSIVMQFHSAANQLWDDGFAIMGGGHADFGGAQSPSIIIDLGDVASTTIESKPANNSNITSTDYPVLKIGGGAEAGSVYSALDGTGWAFLGPRAASIGVGGFLLGGGIAFQTNRYGVANDNLLGIEVVLVNGTIVYANPTNEYSDLFWAATGGGWLGFGVVTHFYLQAYPDPGDVYVGTIAWGENKASEVFNKSATWWESNTDPDAFPALLYYLKDPTNINALVPVKERQFTFQLNALYYGGSWAKFNESFGGFYEQADSISLTKYSLKTLDQYLLTNYPYGYHRLFYGKSHTNSTSDFYENTFSIYKETVNGMIARGEDPGHTLWVDEYVFPGWNGKGPVSDSDTAWPHSTSAHITLTSGEWSLDSTTEYLYSRDKEMMYYLRDFQNGLGEPTIYDYPNYIAPYSVTEEVWGAENFKRLIKIKEKYDPKCLFNRGRVPATKACVSRGVATTFLKTN